MCSKCWALVPRLLQDEVYRTVKLRGKAIDESWAPWWRAQAQAIDAAARVTYPDEIPRLDRILAREMAFADTLDGGS
jgi:hypothetical protein